MRDVFDVDAASSNIGRNQQINRGRSRLLHHAITLVLAHSAVQRFDVVAAAAQSLRQLFNLNASPTEDERESGSFKIQHASKRRNLVRARNNVGALPNLRHRTLRCLIARNEHAHWVLQVTLSDARDPRRKRCGKQRGLARFRHRFENQFEVFREAHVEHLIGFVKDNRLQFAQINGATTHVIKHTTWCCDDDMRAALERDDLTMEFLTAVNRRNGDAQFFTVAMKRFAHLHCEFTRWHEHEYEWLAGLWLGGRDTLQKRKRECRGLPRACCGLSEEISAFEERRNRRLLNRRGLLVTKRCELGEKFWSEA